MPNQNQKRLEMQNQRTKEKILLFVSKTYKEPNDIVKLEDICMYLK